MGARGAAGQAIARRQGGKLRMHDGLDAARFEPGPDVLAQRLRAAIRATLSANDINNSLNNIAGTGGEAGKTFARRHRDTLLIDEVAPWAATDTILAGSTDVGDVSWKAPVAQCFSPCFAVGTPLHSWQLVSQGRTSIAHKGMLLAGKVLAATAIRLFSDSALLAASQQELRQVLAERPYRCPIPAEVSPSVLR